MPAVTIQGGMKVEIPNRDEIRQDMTAVWDAKERQNARGFKPIRLAAAIQPAVATLYIPGPESGYIWNLKLISVQVSAADTVQAFISSSAPSTGSTGTLSRLISNFGASAASQIDKWTSSQVLLYPDEGVYLSAAAHTMTAYFLTAAEVPAEMVYKLYD